MTDMKRVHSAMAHFDSLPEGVRALFHDYQYPDVMAVYQLVGEWDVKTIRRVLEQAYDGENRKRTGLPPWHARFPETPYRI